MRYGGVNFYPAVPHPELEREQERFDAMLIPKPHFINEGANPPEALHKMIDHSVGGRDSIVGQITVESLKLALHASSREFLRFRAVPTDHGHFVFRDCDMVRQPAGPSPMVNLRGSPEAIIARRHREASMATIKQNAMILAVTLLVGEERYRSQAKVSGPRI